MEKGGWEDWESEKEREEEIQMLWVEVKREGAFQIICMRKLRPRGCEK